MPEPCGLLRSSTSECCESELFFVVSNRHSNSILHFSFSLILRIACLHANCSLAAACEANEKAVSKGGTDRLAARSTVGGWLFFDVL